MSSVKEFYEGSNVLITGATGFIGKLLLRKLLCSCKDVEIFILIRKKDNNDIKARIKALFENPIFDNFEEECPNYLKKVHTIEGDLADSNLNLTELDQNFIIKKIDIVFHCAANLNMQEKLTASVNTNIKGTKELIELCEKMNNLKAFIMVSTIYSNCEHRVIEEKIYPNRIKADHILSIMEDINEETIESIKDTIIEKSPNIYCYTKALTEEMVKDMGQNLPIGIFRPSIVTSTYKDPFPGWTDNINGLLGPFFLILMGIWRVTLGKAQNKCDFVPADFCVNAIICSAWDVHQRRQQNYEMPIYNFCNNSESRLTWSEVTETLVANYKYSFKNSFWAPYFIYVPNVFCNAVLCFFLHTIPSYVCDYYMMLMGKRSKLIKSYAKMYQLEKVLVYFNLNEWSFKRENVKQLWENLSESDKKEFGFDVNSIEYDSYFANLSIGLKKYFYKEELLDEDIHRLNRLKKYHKISIAVSLIVIVLIVIFLVPYCTFLNKSYFLQFMSLIF